MKTYVEIVKPTDERAYQMLTSCISFINPVKRYPDTEHKICFTLYDCGTKEELDARLGYLNEASAVDFRYGYEFL